MNDTSKLITFFGGFVTGVVISVLFTPLRGKDTRERVDHSLRGFAQGLKGETGKQIMRFKRWKGEVLYAVDAKLKGRVEIEKIRDEHIWI